MRTECVVLLERKSLRGPLLVVESDLGGWGKLRRDRMNHIWVYPYQSQSEGVSWAEGR